MLSGGRTTFVPEGPVQGSPARQGGVQVSDPQTMTDWPASTYSIHDFVAGVARFSRRRVRPPQVLPR